MDISVKVESQVYLFLLEKTSFALACIDLLVSLLLVPPVVIVIVGVVY